MRHEKAYLLECGKRSVLIYLMEVDDPEKAREAYRSSTLPIDLEHRQVMEEALDDSGPAELLYEVRN